MRKNPICLLAVYLLAGWYFTFEPGWNTPKPYSSDIFRVNGPFKTETQCHAGSQDMADRLRTPSGAPRYNRISRCFLIDESGKRK